MANNGNKNLKMIQLDTNEKAMSLNEFVCNVSKEPQQYLACYDFSVGMTGHVDDLIAELQKIWDECAMLGGYQGNSSKFPLFAYELFSNTLIYGRLNVPSNLRDTFDPADMRFEEAIEEALIEHGHKLIKISFNVRQDRFQVTVNDGGEGFDWRKLPADVLDVLEKPHGKGILIMRSFGAKLRWNEKGNEVTLTLRVDDD